jgi:hypothetical protein
MFEALLANGLTILQYYKGGEGLGNSIYVILKISHFN